MLGLILIAAVGNAVIVLDGVVVGYLVGLDVTGALVGLDEGDIVAGGTTHGEQPLHLAQVHFLLQSFALSAHHTWHSNGTGTLVGATVGDNVTIVGARLGLDVGDAVDGEAVTGTGAAVVGDDTGVFVGSAV